MSSLQQGSRFLPFSNNNIQRKQLSMQGGLSLSGSDTDVSTSNENLSNEERYVIRHTARQEPQGQENQQSPSRSSCKENVPLQGTLLRTLKDRPKDALNSNRASLASVGSNRSSLKENLSNRTSVGSNRSSLDVSSSSYSTLIIHGADDGSWVNGRLSGVVREPTPTYFDLPQGKGQGSPVQSLSNLQDYEQTGCQEITDIPDDYLSQSQVLKHLAKEAKLPPPSYSGDRLKQDSIRGLLAWGRGREKLTRSQPDLSRLAKGEGPFRTPSSPRPQTKGREETETSAGEIWPPSEMIQIVIQENSALKLELERCYNKVAKSQKLEQEIAKVHRAHEELAASCERREKLERAARLRLQNDCRRLGELNRALRDQIDLLSSRTESPSMEGMRKELTQREVLIGQLITQNKELAAAKERQEIELAAQRATLQEQRTHIDILDTALTNAQGNVVRLEEECRKKHVYVERVGQLQRLLSSLQASSDRREETERQLRGQLERELREGQTTETNGEIAELKRRMRERDERIMQLEGEVGKWEQRYLEESALRQAAIDAASLPKDAKIAALEKTSQDAEKLIAEARSEKIRHMDEVHAAQKKLADLESRMKDLESKLAERDAMIRVLQKHTYDKDSSSSSGVGSYPAAHSSHSSGSGEHHGTPELVSSVLGSGSSYTTTTPYVTDSYKYRKQGSFEQTNKSLDDQLKELDSQLLSKRALCCFPGLSNPGAATRAGEVPEPLLAGLGPISRGSERDMLLLEKQGRRSQEERRVQEERRGPPSSLPRPPRARSRYCRLSDSESRKKELETNEYRIKKPSTKEGSKELYNSSELQTHRMRKDKDKEKEKEKEKDKKRSLIPPPTRRIDYGRLSEGTIRKKSGARDSGGSSEASTSSLPTTKRSIPRPNYRIQF